MVEVDENNVARPFTAYPLGNKDKDDKVVPFETVEDIEKSVGYLTGISDNRVMYLNDGRFKSKKKDE